MNCLTKLLPGTNGESKPVLSVLGKQTFVIDQGKRAGISSERQIPFYESDGFKKSPGRVSELPLCESDLVPFKPGTNLIVRGSACSPRGRKTAELMVSLQLESTKRSLLVSGNRKVRVNPLRFNFTRPEPFSRIPLEYSLAYGGQDSLSQPGVPYTYLKNPIGKGFIVKNNPGALHGLELPNIENPRQLLTPQNLVLHNYNRWSEYPEPAGFAFRPRNFYPRYTYAGSGLNPEPRFHNCAPPGLQFENLTGNENIRLTYMDPDYPEFHFQLPGSGPTAWLETGSGKNNLTMIPQTIEILKDLNLMTVVWCSAFSGMDLASMQNLDQLEYGVDEGL